MGLISVKKCKCKKVEMTFDVLELFYNKYL